MQTFPSKCNTRKLQSKTWNIAEKTHSNNGSNYTHQYNQVKEAVTSFLLLCLNHIWAPGQRHVCFSKSSRFFLVFAGQKHISGSRRATNEQVQQQAPSTSFNFQSTTITLNEAEYQKTVNTKLGKQTIWFSEVIKNIYHYFQEKQAGRRKRQKIKMHCFPKAYQSVLQNHMAEKYKLF